MPKRDSTNGRFITDKSKPTYDGMGIWISVKGYPTVWKDGKCKKVHVLEWEKHNGPKPEDMELHHIDEDKENWDIDNLELLTNSDHQKIHAGWVRDENGEWIAKPCKDCGETLPLDDFYQRKGHTPLHYCIECAKERYQDRNTKEYREKRKKYMKEYYEKNKHEKWGIKK